MPDVPQGSYRPTATSSPKPDTVFLFILLETPPDAKGFWRARHPVAVRPPDGCLPRNARPPPDPAPWRKHLVRPNAAVTRTGFPGTQKCVYDGSDIV